jgi:hypothetical protein
MKHLANILSWISWIPAHLKGRNPAFQGSNEWGNGWHTFWGRLAIKAGLEVIVVKFTKGG